MTAVDKIYSIKRLDSGGYGLERIALNSRNSAIFERRWHGDNRVTLLTAPGTNPPVVRPRQGPWLSVCEVLMCKFLGLLTAANLESDCRRNITGSCRGENFPGLGLNRWPLTFLLLNPNPE